MRLHADANYETGEYAILVRSDMKGKGLGWLLMQRIMEYSSAEGLKTIEGQVLRDNITMLAMCKKLGFDIAADPNDADIWLVRREIAELVVRVDRSERSSSSRTRRPTIEILVLAGAQRPEKGGKAGKSERQRHRHEIDQHVHGGFTIGSAWPRFDCESRLGGTAARAQRVRA